MRKFRPSYYDSFSCIADRCRHNCCIGWEIDIDEDTLEEYVNCKTEFGRRLKKNISLDGDAHFILGENERCPFLNKDNLCDIIINMGEGSLCQICSDHPRFVNDFFDREETGIGMCCEEAARIILSYPEKVCLVGESGQEDRIVYLRDMTIEMLQNRGKTIDERIENVLKTFKLQLPKKDWVEVFKRLERLDEKWSERLKTLKRDGTAFSEDWSVPFEQILVYFVYRHMSGGFYDKRYNERILFSVLSFYMIREMFRRSSENMESLIDICRMYSSEIEYSEDNVEELLGCLSDEKSIDKTK